MTFRITGPGLYKNRRGEKVEITELKQVAIDHVGEIYGLLGNYYDCDSQSHDDIVGVCGEPDYEIPANPCVIGMGGKAREFKPVSCQTLNIQEQPMTDVTMTTLKGEAAEKYFANKYDLTKTSERFRALEDGRSLKGPLMTLSPEYSNDFAAVVVCSTGPWSLVPETKRVVTKLYAFEDVTGHNWVVRCYNPQERLHEHACCLGAIEGSEQTEEVEV